MMGRTHATSGAVAYLALQPILNTTGIIDSTPTTLIVGTIAAAGGALLPDLDHQHATVTQSLGFITKAATAVITPLSGGHRNGTHSLLGLIAFTTLAYTASLHPVAVGLLTGFLFAIATAALRLDYTRCTPLHTICTTTITAAAIWIGTSDLTSTLGLPGFTLHPLVIPTSVAIGVLAHIAGDMLTKEGCPLAWPLSKTRLHLLTLTTGGTPERILGVILAITAISLCLWQAGGLTWIATMDWQWLLTQLQ